MNNINQNQQNSNGAKNMHLSNQSKESLADASMPEQTNQNQQNLKGAKNMHLTNQSKESLADASIPDQTAQNQQDSKGETNLTSENQQVAIVSSSSGQVGNNDNRTKIRKLVRAAVIAALYVSLTMVVIYAAYGTFQFRISEALTILPLFFPEAIAGLTIGCFIANLFGNGALDLTLGTAATLVAAVITFLIGRTKLKNPLKIILAILPPVLINAFVVPFTFLAVSELEELYWFNVMTVGLGQLAVLTLLGIPLYYALKRIKSKIKAFN